MEINRPAVEIKVAFAAAAAGGGGSLSTKVESMVEVLSSRP